MNVRLLQASQLDVTDEAISKCWDKPSKNVVHKLERMDRVINKHKHASTAEHIVYTWDIDGISRACLQELARHRMQSMSVKSTRYTLKELLTADDLSDFIVKVNPEVDKASVKALKRLLGLLKQGLSNDVVKYCLPEAFKTSLISTMNVRGFQNFLELRLSKAALPEIRELAWNMYSVIPDDHKFLYEDIIEGAYYG